MAVESKVGGAAFSKTPHRGVALELRSDSCNGGMEASGPANEVGEPRFGSGNLGNSSEKVSMEHHEVLQGLRICGVAFLL